MQNGFSNSLCMHCILLNYIAFLFNTFYELYFVYYMLYLQASLHLRNFFLKHKGNLIFFFNVYSNQWLESISYKHVQLCGKQGTIADTDGADCKFKYSDKYGVWEHCAEETIWT